MEQLPEQLDKLVEEKESVLENRRASRISILKRKSMSQDDSSEDVTTVKESKRVSFASSKSIKPFAADPEKNTIWDSTYEEEADLTPPKSSDTDQISVLQKTFCNITLKENMELTCISQESEINTVINQKTDTSNTSMQFTCVLPPHPETKTHDQSIDASSMQLTSMVSDQTEAEVTNMQLTCVVPAQSEEHFGQNADTSTMQFTCVLQNHPDKCKNETVNQDMECSMQFTCLYPRQSIIKPHMNQHVPNLLSESLPKQLPEEITYTVADKENVFPNSQPNLQQETDINMQLPTQSGIETPFEQNMENSMQLTCVFPKQPIKCYVDQQFKSNLLSETVTSLKQLPKEEITYTLADKENVFPNSQLNLQQDMDVNMQLPTQSGIETPLEQNMENSMQLTCVFPKQLIKSHVDQQFKSNLLSETVTSLKQLPKEETTYIVADKENVFPNSQPNLQQENTSKLESNETMHKSLVDIIHNKTKVSKDEDIIVEKVVYSKTVVETTCVSKMVVDKGSEMVETDVTEEIQKNNASKRTTRATTKDAKIRKQKTKELPLTKVEELKQVPQENIVSKLCTRSTSKVERVKEVVLKKDAEILEKSPTSKKMPQPETFQSIPEKETPSKITNSLENQIQTNEAVAIKITEAEKDDRCPENDIDFFSQSRENVLTKSKNEKLQNDLGMIITPESSFAFAIIARRPDEDEEKNFNNLIQKEGSTSEGLIDMELAPQFASTSMDISQEPPESGPSFMDVSQEQIPPKFGDKSAPASPEIVEKEESAAPSKVIKAIENFRNIIATINAKPKLKPRPFPVDLLKRNEEADKKIKSFLENFKLPEIEIVDFEELDKIEKEYEESSETLGSGRSSDGFSASNSGNATSIEAPKTLEERVRENVTRTPKLIAFVKIMEETCFCFFTFYKAVPFQAYVDVNSGIVEKIDAFTSLMKVAYPEWKYQATCLQEKLKMERCVPQLGKGFDLITFLDYVYMSTEETINFQKEFYELENTYGNSHRFRMDSDFCIIIEIMNVRLLIWWIITLEMSMEHIGRIKSIKSRPRERYEDDPPPEKEIERILENTPGPNILENFIKNLDEFVKHEAPKILSRRDERYRNRIRLL